MNKGLSFEKRVEEMYSHLGKKSVERDIHIRDKGIHSQFDLTYGSRKKYYIECKYRSDSRVSFSDVATFAAKLYLHGIPYSKGIIVTNATYDVRSKAYSKKRGLTLIDGKKLRSLESTPRSLWARLF